MGANFTICADISKFFTKIPKSAVTEIIAAAVPDDDFVDLFKRAIAVELSNMAELREKANAFPTHDIGVAQGNSLSPLLGNILLFDFDSEMNDGDCRCIRYIDDIIILGPSKKAVIARFKKARRILAKYDMDFGSAKTSGVPVAVTATIEFLGIELSNKFIRSPLRSHKRDLSRTFKRILKMERGLLCKGEMGFRSKRSNRCLLRCGARME